MVISIQSILNVNSLYRFLHPTCQPLIPPKQQSPTVTIQCAPHAVESFEANQPPLIFPGDAPVRLLPPPMLFPTDAVSKIVHVDVAPPPSVFPTNRADVIRAGDQSTSAKEPPVIFPTDRSQYNIVEPNGESVNVTLANLKVRQHHLLLIQISSVLKSCVRLMCITE